MAEIEKGLPGETRTQAKIPGPEDIEIKEEVQQEKPPVEVIPNEDGSATIDFEPGAINIPGTEKHFDNLAILLPDDVLWIELLHELPLIWILIRRLQHFHVWCELGARLAHVRHVLLFGGGGVRHDGRTIESVA